MNVQFGGDSPFCGVIDLCFASNFVVMVGSADDGSESVREQKPKYDDIDAHKPVHLTP